MRKRFWVIALMGILLQTGCMSWNPPPYEFERWKKPGASIQQVMASLLECGYPWPDANIDQLIRAWGLDWVPSSILADRCMEAQGYAEEGQQGTVRRCTRYLHKESSIRKYSTAEQIQALEHACDPNTPTPQPSVEKRLSSPYCKVKEYSLYPQCQPVVVPSSPQKEPSLLPVIVPQYPVVDRVSPQVQKDSDSQMNQLLQGTGGRR